VFTPNLYPLGTAATSYAYQFKANVPLAVNDHAHLRDLQANYRRFVGHQAS